MRIVKILEHAGRQLDGIAERALQTCPDGRDAITRHMVALSTYLGHKSVAETYWYLEAVPDLMRDIADRAECLAAGGRP